MKLYFKKAGAYLACLMMIITLLPSAAIARDAMDTERTDCALAITYPKPNITFRLYYVAKASAYGEFTPADDFKDYKVSFTGLDSSGWKNLAATLDGYVKRDKLQPVDKKSTDKNGKLTFSGKRTGLYLVTWDKHIAGGYTYKPQPFLVSLPQADENDNWVYSVDAEPKYDKNKTTHGGPGNPDTVNRRVMKIWKDDGNKAERPKSVTVQLLKNGEVYKEVTLSTDNNWRHEWKGLSKADTWQIVEKNVPEGYSVSVGREGITFTVTNTKDEPKDDPTQPKDDPTNPPDNPKDDPTNPPDNPKDDPTNPPDNPKDDPTNPPHNPKDDPTEPHDDSTEPSDDEDGDEDGDDDMDTPNNKYNNPREKATNPGGGGTIPQTGQLWWPVPMLMCGGMGLLTAGLMRRRKSESGETDE